MRKLSELYQIVLDNYYKISQPGICVKISRCYNELNLFTFDESDLIDDHFEHGDHKLQPKLAENENAYLWPEDHDLPRIEYLKYLIDLCKSQEAKEQL